MAKITKRGEMTIIGDDLVRIEPGPARKTATATKELLADDVTHSRYFAGERDVGGQVMKGRDAAHREIKLGQPMEYLDHLADPVLYVYGRRSLTKAEQALRGDGATFIFEAKKTFALGKEADALAFAQKLAGE